MQESNPKSSFPLAKLIAIASVILLVGGAAAWWAKSSLKPSTQAPLKGNPSVTEVKPEIPAQGTNQEQQVQIAWLDTTGNSVKLYAKNIEVDTTLSDEQLLNQAFQQLLSGPEEKAGYTSAIPVGTKLLSLENTNEGIKVNLSQEFINGGGSTSMSARLAQVIYTASSLDKNSLVWISVEGQPLDNLGGEGITVSQPMTAKEFEANFSL